MRNGDVVILPGRIVARQNWIGKKMPTTKRRSLESDPNLKGKSKDRKKKKFGTTSDVKTISIEK